MEDADREELLKEQISRLNFPYWLLKLLGFGRFDISRGKIVHKSLFSILFNLPVMFILHISTYWIIYELYIEKDYLNMAELTALLDCLGYYTTVVTNSFVNRYAGAKFLNMSVDLDHFLGAKETKFMREIFSRTFIISSVFIFSTQFMIMAILNITYLDNVHWSICVCGFFFTEITYFVYFDIAFLVSLYTMLSLRVRYLNVSIMKLANVKLEYIPLQFPFNTLFWNKYFDDKVDLHLRTDDIQVFIKAFTMIFQQLRYLEQMYSFTLIIMIIGSVLSAPIAVQSWIDWFKNEDMDKRRMYDIIGWCVLNWLATIASSQQMAMFQRQIDQTNLICTFIQLKPNYEDKIYELTARIIRELEVRDPRISVYDLFHFDTSLLLQIISSTFVYITMQLQIAFPKSPDATVAIVENITTPHDSAAMT